MKRFAILAAGALLAVTARPAASQVFGQYTGATPIGMNARLFGAYASFTKSESELISQLRLSFYPNVDFGFQGGLARVSVLDRSRTSIKLGADFKGLVGRASETFPVDLSLGAAIGVTSAEDFNLLGVGPQIVLSRTTALPRGASLTPYVSALALFTRSDLQNANDTDVSVPVRFGAEYQPITDFRIVVELQVAVSDQINDDLRLVLGANFPF